MRGARIKFFELDSGWKSSPKKRKRLNTGLIIDKKLDEDELLFKSQAVLTAKPDLIDIFKNPKLLSYKFLSRLRGAFFLIR